MGGAVLAEADGVVGPDVDGVDVHQRGESDRRPHVVGELQERAAERAGRSVQHDPGEDRAHRVLAHPEVQHPAVPVGFEVVGRNRWWPKGFDPVDGGVVAAGQVGGTAPELGQFGSDVVEHLAEGLAGGHRFGARLPVGDVGVPTVGQLLGQQPVQQLLALGFTLGPRVERRLPLLVCLAAAVDEFAGVADDLVADLEGLVGIEPEHLLRGGDLVLAERGAVHAAGVHLVGCGIADDGAQRDERRLVGDLLGLGDCLLDGDDVLAPLDLLHVPPVGPVARRDVLGQRDVGVVLDGDLVLVVEHDEIAELLGARERRRLAGDALFDVAVGGDHVDVVVERALTPRRVGVEQAALVT